MSNGEGKPNHHHFSPRFPHFLCSVIRMGSSPFFFLFINKLGKTSNHEPDKEK